MSIAIISTIWNTLHQTITYTSSNKYRCMGPYEFSKIYCILVLLQTCAWICSHTYIHTHMNTSVYIYTYTYAHTVGIQTFC